MTTLTPYVSPLSGDLNTDALIDQSHLTQNYQIPFADSVDYSFNPTDNFAAPFRVKEMTAWQKNDVRLALDAASQTTGVTFTDQQAHSETRDISFGYAVLSPGIAGVDYTNVTTDTDILGNVTGIQIHDTIVLNSLFTDLRNPDPGTQGFEVLLHEIGHALGLKNPSVGAVTLPASIDNTGNTVMSTNGDGVWHSQYGPLDVQTLNWLYGGDGLRGVYGLTVDSLGNPVAGGFNPALISPATISGVTLETTSTTPLAERDVAPLSGDGTASVFAGLDTVPYRPALAVLSA